MNWIKLTRKVDLDFDINIIHQAGLAFRMNKKLTAKSGKWHLILWPLMVLGSVLLIIWSPNGLLHLRQLHLEHQELIQKNNILEKENHLLYEEIGLLRNDPAAIEHLARQELGLVKDGELIFQFVSPPSEK
jgi:cell division protein FtsB